MVRGRFLLRLTTLYFCSLWTPLTNIRVHVSPIGVWLPFRIYKMQCDENPHFVEEIQTLDGAKERVQELGKLWPGEYVIQNEETGERVVISASGEAKN
jgi:hypothetical protein